MLHRGCCCVDIDLEFETGCVDGHCDFGTTFPSLPSQPSPPSESLASPPSPPYPAPAAADANLPNPSLAKRATHAVQLHRFQKDSAARTARLSWQVERGVGVGY